MLKVVDGLLLLFSLFETSKDFYTCHTPLLYHYASSVCQQNHPICHYLEQGSTFSSFIFIPRATSMNHWDLVNTKVLNKKNENRGVVLIAYFFHGQKAFVGWMKGPHGSHPAYRTWFGYS